MDSQFVDRSVGDMDLISRPWNGGNGFQFMEKSGVKQLPVTQTCQDTQADENPNVDGSRNLEMESILDSSHPSHCPSVESSKTGQIRYNLGAHDLGDLAISLARASLGVFQNQWGHVGGKHCT